MNSQNVFDRSSWKQWLAAFAASSIMLNASFLDIPWKSQIILDYGLVDLIKGIVSIFVVSIGAFLGAVLADIFGRKITLLGALIFVIPRVLGLVFIAETWIWIVQIFTEFGSGVTCTVVPLYISEIAGTNNRGKLMVIQLLMPAIGILIILGQKFIAAHYESPHVYMIMNGLTLGIAVLFHGAVIAIFPETPQYLNSKKKYQEAAKSLAFFRGTSHVKVQGESHELPTAFAQTNRRNQGCSGKMGEFFKFANRRSLAIIFSLVTIRWASGQNIIQILLMGLAVSWDDNYSVYIFPALFVIQLFFSAFVTLTVDIFKRKISVISVILVSLIAAIAGMATLGGEIASQRYWIYFVVFIVQNFVHLVILGVTLAYVGEFFSTDVRAFAIATVVSFELLIRNISILSHLLFFSQVNALEYRQFVCFLNGPVYFFGFLFVLIFFPRVNKLPCSEIAIETSTGIQNLS